MGQQDTDANRRNVQMRGGSFYGSIQHRSQISGATFTDLRHNCPRKLPSHSHELPFFCMTLGGDYGERYGRQECQLRPFTFIFRPAEVPHQDEVGPRGVLLFGIEISGEWQEGVLACSGKLDTPHNDAHGGDLFTLGLRIFHETRARVIDQLATESLVAELLGATARMPDDRGSQAPNWIRRVLVKLQDQYCEHLTLNDLSREAGVHPVHLSRVFRRFMRVGIPEYVHRMRIRAACELLLKSEMTLAEISFAVGFADQSHFTRAFRRYTQLTPAAFRVMAAPSTRFQEMAAV